ncbi:putative oxidoreductase [Azospirillum fermentarium]|uniref:DoxX family protein n=1 Tax=Azospirillum fermentarium TaxID=1233114 RepID=UPI002225CCB5|nr:DoxX family protein [Azospirillum fermentarium]MCW2247089.1 putative oxidoreductase [Azospirillum fermentarium]
MSFSALSSTGLRDRVAVIDRLSVFSDPLVRVTAGLLLMPHGAQKLFGLFGGYGLTATGEFFATQLGLHPGIVFALLAGLVEFFGGLALVLGLLTRPAALAVAALMGVAVVQVHLGNGFFWTSGGYEYPLMWGLTAVAIALKGGDRFSLDRRLGLPL